MTTPTRPKLQAVPHHEIADLIEKRDGDCFVVAAHIVALFDRPFALSAAESKARELALAIGREDYHIALVHGWVTRPTDGKRHVHAWVEIPDVRLVLDYSNGLEVMTPIAHYYKAGKINEDTIRHYDRDETRELLIAHEHYGPWHEMDDAEPDND
jgi:hypothetical protein